MANIVIAALILRVCLGSVCRDVNSGIPDLSLIECAIEGQRIAQEWLADHPNFSLNGWSCQIGERGRDS
jgi:hypothetical protein